MCPNRDWDSGNPNPMWPNLTDSCVTQVISLTVKPHN